MFMWRFSTESSCDDGKWRALDGQAFYRARPAAESHRRAIAEESLSRRLGVSFATRPDGVAREIVGVDEVLRDRFSARRRAISEGVAELAGAYQDQLRPGAECLCAHPDG